MLVVWFQDQIKGLHLLDVNTLKGHTDIVTVLCFTADGLNVAIGGIINL